MHTLNGLERFHWEICSGFSVYMHQYILYRNMLLIEIEINFNSNFTIDNKFDVFIEY